MTDFDWTSALTGGVLIGLSVTMLMLLLGRIAGISGILAGCFDGGHGNGGWDGAWRIAFILGLIVVPFLAGASGFNVLPPRMPASYSLTALAGLLVGFGTRLGGGCTSGHGVCGIARLSPRSLTATAIFVATAATVVAVTRHVVGG
ncbi:MAG: YeeE/YedE family protein [Bradyrhizobiaceae bacterium]|nr:YeeE/YedE family protein [Bradyrhizobiaceae bacterium]